MVLLIPWRNADFLKIAHSWTNDDVERLCRSGNLRVQRYFSHSFIADGGITWGRHLITRRSSGSINIKRRSGNMDQRCIPSNEKSDLVMSIFNGNISINCGLNAGLQFL